MTAAIGYLSVRKHTLHGYFGGYLIVNRIGRPLEFHCTMPVKPSRAQELLYGPTLDDFVGGEQIARALTMKAKLKPQVVLSDTNAALAVAQVSSIAVAALKDLEVADVNESLQVPTSNANDHSIADFESHQLVIPPNSTLEGEAFVSALQSLQIGFDLEEPFQRVVEALLEAHPIAKAA